MSATTGVTSGEQAAYGALDGLMQDDFQLTLNHIRGRLRAGNHGAEVVTLLDDGSVQRCTHAELAERIDRLARVLARLGIGEGERVGTFAWNNQRHLECYFAVPCTGAVLHTLNIRLFAEQLTYIVNHAEDSAIFVDASLVPVLERLAPTFETVRHYIVMGDGDTGSLPGALRYEELMAEAGPGPFAYPDLDERRAAALCYTSGTTGNPKGVLYSHRSISMHSSVETRYPFLDDDVISFCAGIAPEYKLHGMTEKWILRQVAAKTLPKQIANRPKTMFRASLAKTFLDENRPHWVDQLLSPESLRKTGYFDPKTVARERAWQMMMPRITAKRFVYDVALTCVVSTQLWHHLFCGGDLCDLAPWSPPVPAEELVPEVVGS